MMSPRNDGSRYGYGTLRRGPGGVSMGQAIAECIDGSGLTTRAVAKEIGFGESSLCRWKTDDRVPHVDALADMEEVTGNSVGTVLVASGYVNLEQVGWFCPHTGDLLDLEWEPSCNGDTVEHEALYRFSPL